MLQYTVFHILTLLRDSYTLYFLKFKIILIMNNIQYTITTLKILIGLTLTYSNSYLLI
jgi:hypothetical protein